MKRLIIVLFVLSFVLQCQDIFSQTNQKRDVEVFCSLNTQTCVVGEPVYLTFEFQNTTDLLVEFRTQLSLYGDVKVNLTIPRKLPVDYRGAYKPTIQAYYVFEIPPKKVERVAMTLLYSEDSPDGLIFDRPMTVPISVSLEGLIDTRKVKYEFPSLQLEVKEPQASDMPAFLFLRKKSLAYDIHQSRAARENVSAFETFLKQFPDSVYSPYVLFSIANGYSVKTQTQNPDYPRAIELFKKYIERYPNTILTDDAVYKIGDCYNSLGDKKMAKQWFIKLLNDYPKSNRLNYYDPLMKEYIFIPAENQTPKEMWMLYDQSTAVDRSEPGKGEQPM